MDNQYILSIEIFIELLTSLAKTMIKKQSDNSKNNQNGS